MGKKPKGKQALMLGDWDDEGGEGDLTANPIVEKTAEIATSPAPIQKQIEEEETEAQDEEEQESQTAATTTTLSKKEKEKLKKKRQAEKKKLEKAQAASSTGGDDGGAKGDGGKKEETKLEKIAKGGGVRAAALNALKEKLALQKAEEARIAQLQKEEDERVEREIAEYEAEEARKQALKDAKKQREKEKKEQLRKEGKLVSKAEKERQQRNALRLQQTGWTPEQLAEQARKDAQEAAGEVKKKVVYKSKKSKGKTAGEKTASSVDAIADTLQHSTLDTPPKEEKAPIEPKAEPEPEEEVEESWEEAADTWEDNVSETKEDEEDDASEKEDSEDESEDDDDEAGSFNDSGSDDSDGDEPETKEEKAKREFKQLREQRALQAKADRNKDDLRSPICCILGHVDTGKTKLLDKIRQTNVQEGEAGGITQQIGATYFPIEEIQKKCACLNKNQRLEYKVPGLLIIDTPGHESFTNLRSRGNNLCNIAVLVIDIMHGLEQQTKESIGLLKSRKTPFVVALNKIDRLYTWEAHPNLGFKETLSMQNDAVKREFEDRLQKTKLALAEEGLNAELHYRNTDIKKTVSLVPTSAHTGEGIPDLLMIIIALTQKMMAEELMFSKEIEATVLEVKMVVGHGMTVDVILVNGILHEGDRIVLCGMNGPIVTNIRALLTPQPMKELRIKSAYVHNKECKAALGIKISAPGLDKAVAGSRLLVCGADDNEEVLKEDVMVDLENLLKAITTEDKGVCVQSSTLGSLEALLSFLSDMKIPVAGIAIGPVYRKDVMRASVALEHKKEFACILAFDVVVEKDAQEFADSIGVKIFQADIIYHLFDHFTAYMKNIEETRKAELAGQAIWPCTLKIVPGAIFNKKDPIVIGVEVMEGTLRVGTPICVPSRDRIVLGKVFKLEHDHKPIPMAKKGQQVSMGLAPLVNDTGKSFGRHFDESDMLCSKISRQSIDILKEFFRNDLKQDDAKLIKKLKGLLDVT